MATRDHHVSKFLLSGFVDPESVGTKAPRGPSDRPSRPRGDCPTYAAWPGAASRAQLAFLERLGERLTDREWRQPANSGSMTWRPESRRCPRPATALTRLVQNVYQILTSR